MAKSIRMLGLGVLVSSGCAGNPPPEPIPGNPPPQIPGNPPQPQPDTPPVSALPNWEEVKSGHPEGATNPPSPYLIVDQETSSCFKGWQGGMKPWPKEMHDIGGKVVPTKSEAQQLGTEVICPEGQPATILQKYSDSLSEKKTE